MTQGVVVDFNANTAKFTEGVDKSVHSLNKFKADAVQMGKAIGVAFAAATAAAAYLVKESIDTADAMSKMAQSTGIAIEKLSGLVYAGSLADVEMEAIGSAMVKLTKGMADAAVGTGEAMRGYEALGITVKDASGNLKGADVVLAEVAEKFAGMEDGANKTALAVAIFGKSGAAMIPMLNSGASGLAEMHAEAAKLGLVLDTETGQAAERFNDNLTRLNAVKEGFSNQVMKAMLPALENLSVAMFDSASNAGGLDAAVRATAAGIKLLMSAAAALIGTFKSYGEALGGAAAATVAFFSGDFKGAVTIAEMTVSDFGANVAASIKTINDIWDEEASKAESKAPETAKKLAAPMMKSLEEINKAKKASQVEADKLAKEELKRLEEFNRELQADALKAQAVIADTDLIYKASLAWQELAELIERGLLTAEQAGASYASTFGEAAEKMKESTDQMAEYAKQAGRNIQDSFAEFLFDPFKGGVQGMLDNFTIMLRKMAAEALASNILRSVGDWGSTGGGAGSFLGDIASSVFGGARAGGGAVSGGVSYLVGERGPEIFTPSSAGNITPNDKIGGRAVTVVNNFSISQPTDRRTQEQIAAMAGASIQTAMMRGA